MSELLFSEGVTERLGERLAELRYRVVFNPGSSAAACADLIESLVQRL
ncbi:MAG: hypothetical protein ACREX3_16760 [Gammaproteobacteria bacterium]